MPSRKFIIVFAAVLLSLGGTMLSYRIRNEALRERDAKKTRVAATAHPLPEAKDTDGDGLADWEEILWKTDPANPDTDGDGIPDNVMVERLKSQQEKTKKQTISQESKIVPQPEPQNIPPQTLTDETAQQLIADYLKLKNGRGTLSPTDTATIAQNALQSVTNQHLADVYTPKQLTYAEDDTETQLRYVNEIGAALQTHFGKFDTNELDLYLSGNRESGIDTGAFDPYLAAYAASEKQLLAIAVPPSFLKLHLDLLNSFHNTAIAVEAMKASADDPIRGTLGVGWYLQEVNRSRDFLKSMYAAMQDKRLIVSSKDPGFLFMEYGVQL